MFPSKPSQSRYLQAVRRSTLARAVAVGALTLVPVACGNDDAGAFSASSDTISAESTTTDTTTTDSSSAAAPVAEAPTTAVVPADSATFPTGAEVVVDFTFASSSGGQVKNPYVAVWVEDGAGNLVQTISLWYQSGKGTKYLSDLRAWASASGGDIDSTTSGATRAAGTYSVAWDGTDADGNPVAQGDYVLFVEAAREHGPYEITSTPITIGNDGFTVSLADNGELADLSATLTV